MTNLIENDPRSTELPELNRDLLRLVDSSRQHQLDIQLAPEHHKKVQSELTELIETGATQAELRRARQALRDSEDHLADLAVLTEKFPRMIQKAASKRQRQAEAEARTACEGLAVRWNEDVVVPAISLPVPQWIKLLPQAHDIARAVGFWCHEIGRRLPYDPDFLVGGVPLYMKVPPTPWLARGVENAGLAELIAAIVGSPLFQQHIAKVNRNGHR